jgi:hypothetical protein
MLASAREPPNGRTSRLSRRRKEKEEELLVKKTKDKGSNSFGNTVTRQWGERLRPIVWRRRRLSSSTRDGDDESLGPQKMNMNERRSPLIK